MYMAVLPTLTQHSFYPWLTTSTREEDGGAHGAPWRTYKLLNVPQLKITET